MKPLLSVAVITYNQEAYIAQTLDSILSQKHEFPYEIVVGEDKSPDSTRKIVEEYAARYPDVIKPLYNEPNKGLIGNYFNVLAHCSGKYVMECAGDDFWLPGKVQKQISYMEAHPEVALCTGNIRQCDENGIITGSYRVKKARMTFERLFLSNVIPAVTVCFRKSVFDEYLDVVNPLSRPWRMEDCPLWIYISHGYAMHHINEFVAVYRVMPVSESHFVSSEKQKAFEDSCRDIRAFYAERFNVPELYTLYLAEEAFSRAWNAKDRAGVVKNGRVVLKKYFDFKRFIMYMMARTGVGF